MITWWLWCVVCLLIAIGISIYAYGQQKVKADVLQTHMEQSIGRHAVPDIESEALSGIHAFSVKPSVSPLLGWLPTWIAASNWRAWGLNLRKLVGLGLFGCAVILIAWMQTDAILGLLAGAVYVAIVVFVLWWKLTKTRRRMLEQLPVFLDSMVRLLAVGNSPQAAFQMAAVGVHDPLGTALQQAQSTLTASSNLAHAMEQLHRHWALPEFGLLAAVFRMSTQYGGRADQVLERVATYIRDRLSAERELRAMSSEVRLSAWVLSLLPLVVGVLIMFLNPGYFMHLWREPDGRQMLAVAAGLEIAGVLLLYRLASLR